MVYLGTRSVPEGAEAQTLWSHKQADPVWHGAPGDFVRVVCFTNCAQAELSLNGRSLGSKSLTDAPDRVLFWDVPYEPGTLSVQGFLDGEAVATAALKTSGPAHALRTETDDDQLTADGIDLCHIAVTVIDADGVPVFDGGQEITWSISGPARLIGLESGDPMSHEDYQAPVRRAFHGRLLGYIQTMRTPGPITIRLSAPGLTDTEIEIRTVET